MALDPPPLPPFRPFTLAREVEGRGGMGRCTTFWPTHSRPSPSLDDDIGPLDLFTYDVHKVFGFFTPPPPPPVTVPSVLLSHFGLSPHRVTVRTTSCVNGPSLLVCARAA